MLNIIAGFIKNLVCVVLGVGGQQNFPPPLSPEAEKECFLRYQNGDVSARSVLIEHNLRLVSHIVRKYYSSNKNQDDLVSIGTIGLIKATDSFNLKNGARFATYAAKCIQNEILMYFRSQKKLCTEISINETIDTDRDGNPLTYGDIVSTEDTIADDIDIKIKCSKAMDFVNKVLDERERKVIVLRYGLDGNRAMTQREVAAVLGISRSYVSRIEKSTLSDMRDYISGRGSVY